MMSKEVKEKKVNKKPRVKYVETECDICIGEGIMYAGEDTYIVCQCCNGKGYTRSRLTQKLNMVND